MPTLGNLVVKILGDVKDVKQKLGEFEKKLDEAKTSTDTFSNRVQNSFKSLIKFGAIIGGSYLAVRKLTDFLKSSLDAYAAQEEAITKLNAALIATGRYTPLVSREMQKYATEMQRLTKFSDDQIETAQGILATFTKIGTETFPEAIEAAMNMSTMFGQDLQQSMVQLGTALNDPIQGVGRLRRIGISFTEEQKELIQTLIKENDLYGAQRVILDELQAEIGGVARAVGQEYAGKVSQLRNAYTDLKETMGAVMAERIEPMLPMITRMVQSLDEWIGRKKALRDAYEKLKEPMKTINDYTRLELTEAEQVIALDEKKKLLQDVAIKGSAVYTSGITKEFEEAKKLVEKKEAEIRARAQLIDNMRQALKLREQETKKTKESADTTKGVVVTTKELVDALDLLPPSLEYVSNLLRGNFAANLTSFGFRLDEARIALMGLNTEIEEFGVEAPKKFGWLDTIDSSFSKVSGTIDNQATKIEELKKKYNEWALNAQSAMGKVTDLTSIAIGSLDAVHSQYYKNREIEIDNWYQDRKNAIEANVTNEEEREKALEALDQEADRRRRELAREEAKAGKSIAVMNAIINTAQAVTKALAQGGFIFGPIFAAIVGALGIKQIALIRKQPLPALAEGGELVTNGPQLILVGDNPGGRELVQATPLSSPNKGGPNQLFHVSINLGDEVLYDGITKATEDGRVLIHKNAVRNW